MGLNKFGLLICLPFAVNAELLNNVPEEIAPPQQFQQNLLRENRNFNYDQQRYHIDKILYKAIQNTEYEVKDKCIYFHYNLQNDSKTFRNCFIIQGNQVQREDNSICDSNRKLRNDCYTKSDDKIKAYVDFINTVQKSFVYEYDQELEILAQEETHKKELRQKQEEIEKAKQAERKKQEELEKAERKKQEELEKKERVSICSNWKTKLDQLSGAEKVSFYNKISKYNCETGAN